jgi:hypothetical protein
MLKSLFTDRSRPYARSYFGVTVVPAFGDPVDRLRNEREPESVWIPLRNVGDRLLSEPLNRISHGSVVSFSDSNGLIPLQSV